MPAKQTKLKKKHASRVANVSRVQRIYPFTRWNNLASSAVVNTLVTPTGSIATSTPILILGTGATSGIYYFSMSFANLLSDLPNYTEFSALFDRYKVNKVTMRIFPVNSLSAAPSGASTATNGGAGAWLHSGQDYDDASALPADESGVNSLRQRLTYRCDNLISAQPIVFSWVPRIAMAAFATGVFTSYANMPPQWIDAASPNVQHYGRKFIFEIFDPLPSTQMFLNFKVEFEYDLSFRDVF